jgi:hypothetical protein
MHRRYLLSIVPALGALALLAGCASRQWRVVAQAAPSPFTNQRTFAVTPIDYTGLVVGDMSEAQYLAQKDADTQGKFLGDKAGINEEFTNALISEAKDNDITVTLATGPTSAPFIIRPYVSFIEPGFYAVVASGKSEVRMTVRITAPNGIIFDEIALRHSTDSASGWSIGGISLNPSAGGRVRKDGVALGKIVAAYLKERVEGH